MLFKEKDCVSGRAGLRMRIEYLNRNIERWAPPDAECWFFDTNIAVRPPPVSGCLILEKEYWGSAPAGLRMVYSLNMDIGFRAAPAPKCLILKKNIGSGFQLPDFSYRRTHCYIPCVAAAPCANWRRTRSNQKAEREQDQTPIDRSCPHPQAPSQGHQSGLPFAENTRPEGSSDILQHAGGRMLAFQRERLCIWPRRA